MKAIILIFSKYSLSQIIEQLLQKTGYETRQLDFREHISSFESKINTQIYRLPYGYRQKWSNYYFRKINDWYISQFKSDLPDLVFVYNNEMLLPDTLKWLKQRGTKIAFYLGDNPLYTHTSPYNLTVLEYADAIFVPDTFWQFQLKKMGFSNVNHIIFPLTGTEYFSVPIDEMSKSFIIEHRHDIVFVGMNYNNSWGYKKAKFLNYFTGFDLKIYGNRAWKRWFQFFPELEKHFSENTSFIPTSDLNKMYNLAKIIPVDGNPGILNGIHLRVLEAIAAGALPIMEYNKDMDIIFDGIDDLPAVRDYRAIPEMVTWYLDNENERLKMVMEMKEVYIKKYNNEWLLSTYFKNL